MLKTLNPLIPYYKIIKNYILMYIICYGSTQQRWWSSSSSQRRRWESHVLLRKLQRCDRLWPFNIPHINRPDILSVHIRILINDDVIFSASCFAMFATRCLIALGKCCLIYSCNSSIDLVYNENINRYQHNQD